MERKWLETIKLRDTKRDGNREIKAVGRRNELNEGQSKKKTIDVSQSLKVKRSCLERSRQSGRKLGKDLRDGGSYWATN